MSKQPVVSATDYPAVEISVGPDHAATEPRGVSGQLLEALKWVFSFPAMLGACMVVAMVSQLRDFQVDPDVWWHIRVGQDIVRTHHWPINDPYSFTVHGAPWLAYEWLGDVVIGFAAQFGLGVLEAFVMCFAGVIAIAIYYFASLSARNSKAGFVSAVVVTIFAVANFNLRPQMFGALFLVLTLIALEHFRQGRPRALWFLPAIFLLWINAHGSWIVGLGVVLVTLLGGLFEFRVGSIEGVRWERQQRIQLELALLGCLAVVPLTPYGTRLATYPFFVASSNPLGIAYVAEWLPMPFNMFMGKLFLGVLVGSLAVQTMFHFKFRLQQWVLAIGGIVMACMHVRFVMLFAPFFAPILAIMLARWIDGYRREKDKFVLNSLLMAAAGFAMLWYFPKQSALEHSVEMQFPVRAVNFLRAHSVQGPIFNSYGYGGYLVGHLPDHKVFIDGREDLYELEGVMGDYLQVALLKPAAFSVLKFYGIRACILGRGEALAVALAEHQDWERVYGDDQSVIFVRRDSQSPGASGLGLQSNSDRSGHESPAD